MEPPTRNEEFNGRNSTNVPSHGTVPKWLEDISQYVFENKNILFYLNL